MPLKLALFVTLRSPSAPSVIAPADLRARLSAVLEPASSVAESSPIVTAPAETNVREPKFVSLPASSPSVIDVPLKLALFVTFRSPSTPSVIAPADVRARLSAVLEPASSVAESSLIATAPADVNVNVPKFVVSPPSSPSVIDVPLKLALFVTATFVPAASVMAADDVSDNDPADTPVNSVLEASFTITLLPVTFN